MTRQATVNPIPTEPAVAPVRWQGSRCRNEEAQEGSRSHARQVLLKASLELVRLGTTRLATRTRTGFMHCLEQFADEIEIAVFIAGDSELVPHAGKAMLLIRDPASARRRKRGDRLARKFDRPLWVGIQSPAFYPVAKGAQSAPTNPDYARWVGGSSLSG